MPGWLWFLLIWVFISLVVCLFWSAFWGPIRRWEDERDE